MANLRETTKLKWIFIYLFFFIEQAQKLFPYPEEFIVFSLSGYNQALKNVNQMTAFHGRNQPKL